MPQFDFASNLPAWKTDAADWADLVKLGGARAETDAAIAESRKKQTDAEQALTARKLFAQHISRGDRRDASGNIIPAGQLDEAGYTGAAVGAGLGPEYLQAPMDWTAKTKASDLNTASSDQRLRSMGMDPKAAGRNGATIGEPPITYVPNPELDHVGTTTISPAPAKERSGWDKVGEFLGFKPKDDAGATPAGAPSTVPADDPNTVNVTGSTYDPAAMGWVEPQSEPSPMVPRQAADTRSARQRVEDSYDPAKTAAARAQAGTKDSGGLDLSWTPVDNGTNQFQQFKSALDAKLKSYGGDAGAYLKDIYGATLRQNMPTAPNDMLLQDGSMEGQAKYNAEVQAYDAGLTKAKGAAEQAVIKAKSDLTEYAKQFGVDTVEQHKSELPGGLMLRDPAKRNEAAALITNVDNIKFAQKAVAEAGNDTTKLRLAYPIVARAYATALNPGQQLSEGNLSEVASALYPDQALDKHFMTNAMLATARWIKSGFTDTSGLDQLNNAIEASDPTAISRRVAAMAAEAERLNSKTLASYTFRRDGTTQDATSSAPAADPAYAGTTDPTESQVDFEANLARKLGMNNYRATKGLPAQPTEQAMYPGTTATKTEELMRALRKPVANKATATAGLSRKDGESLSQLRARVQAQAAQGGR